LTQSGIDSTRNGGRFASGGRGGLPCARGRRSAPAVGLRLGGGWSATDDGCCRVLGVRARLGSGLRFGLRLRIRFGLGQSRRDPRCRERGRTFAQRSATMVWVLARRLQHAGVEELVPLTLMGKGRASNIQNELAGAGNAEGGGGRARVDVAQECHEFLPQECHSVPRVKNSREYENSPCTCAGRFHLEVACTNEGLSAMVFR
jgi:hypothetical protein